MGKAGGDATWLGRLAGSLPIVALLAGCGHHDPIDTPVGWWHQLEGGAIAQQRPPPPGVDDPYPRVGTTPVAAPQVASIELRRSLTDQLIEQRNLSTRLNAHDPLPPPVTAPAKAKTQASPTPAPAAPNPAQSSATLDAADAAPGPTPAAAPPASTKSPAPSPLQPAEQDQLAMPAVVATTAGSDAASVVMPAIPSAPPPPPGLPGIAMPPPPSYVPPPRPDYALSQASGDPLEFLPGSDVLSPGQAGAIHAIAARRGIAAVFVHGYGEATSDAPQDQSHALTLAALRARSLAEALEKDGVPAEAIRIRADAFGRGAIASLID